MQVIQYGMKEVFKVKIIRDGKEIELTSDELYQAYEEKQHLYDMMDIEFELDVYDDDELVEQYGMTREQLNKLVSEMAYRMRKYIDKYDMDFEDARVDAIKDIADEYGETDE